jgi:phosphoserine phosphatase
VTSYLRTTLSCLAVTPPSSTINPAATSFSRTFEGRRHPELARVIDWARGAGLSTLLVSASPRPIVEAAGAALGFEPRDVIAVTAAVDPAGVVLPEVVRPIPYGPGKASLLAARLLQGDGSALLAAFGDNVFDVPMLEAAQLPVVVDPKSRLVAHLARQSLRGSRGEAVQLIVK